MELSSQSDEEEEEGELMTQYVEPLSIKANQTHIWASTNAVGTVRIRNKYTLALQKALALESSFKEKRSGVVEAVPRCQSIASCRTSWKKNQSHRFSQHHVTAFDFSLVRGDRTRTRGRTSSSIFCSTRLDVKSSSRHTLKKSSVLQNEKNVADLKLDRSIGKNSSMPRSAGSEKSQDSRGASKFRGNDSRGIKLLETDKMHTMYSAFFSDFYDIFAEAGPTRRASSKYLREREILLEMKSLISAWADEHRVLQSLPADCDHLIEDSDEDSNNWTITRKPMTANTKIDIRHITFSKFENDPTKNHEIQSEVTYKVQRTREDLHRILPIVLSQIHEPGPWRESKGALFNLQWTWNKGNRNPFTVGKYHLFCQLMNHIPGSALLTRKDSLAKRLSKLNRVTDPIFSHKNWMERAGQICTCSNNIAALDTKRNIQDALTRIIPHTFVLPGDEKALWMFLSSGQSSDRTTALSGEFSGRMKQDRSQRMAPLKNAENLWILKPVGLSRGRGIEVVPESALVKNFSNLSAWISSSCGMSNSSHTFVVQQYIDRPYLIEGRKFDLRVYVLVVQFSPLEAFVSNLGYVRFATHTYSTENASLSSRLAHLTNTELAKDTGTQATFKWELQRLHKYFMGLGTHWPDIWKCVQDIILKSLVCVEPDIPMRPNAFELFGYDILLDDHLKPWLIEVNASPSLEMSCDLDRDVKPHLLIDTIRLLDPIPFDRLALLDVVERRLAENLTHNPYKAMQHGSNNQNHNSIISSNKCTEGMITGTTSQMSDSSYAENNVAGRNKSSKTWNHLELDLQKIFKGRLPRRYGEMPFAIGNYERIAPSERYSSLSKILNSQTTNFSPKKVMKPYKMKLNC